MICEYIWWYMMMDVDVWWLWCIMWYDGVYRMMMADDVGVCMVYDVWRCNVGVWWCMTVYGDIWCLVCADVLWYVITTMVYDVWCIWWCVFVFVDVWRCVLHNVWLTYGYICGMLAYADTWWLWCIIYDDTAGVWWCMMMYAACDDVWWWRM